MSAHAIAINALQKIRAGYKAAGKLIEAKAIDHALAVLRKMQ